MNPSPGMKTHNALRRYGNVQSLFTCDTLDCNNIFINDVYTTLGYD